MTATLGLAVGPDAVRGVVLRRGRIVWHGAVRIQDGAADDIGAALRALLACVPRRRFQRQAAVVAIGSGQAQLRLLEELPPLGDARMLARVVEEGVGRFFLRNGTPLVAGGVRVVSADSAWACAFERPLVTDVVRACRDRGIRVDAIVPTVIAVPHATGAREFTWIEGGRAFSITATGGQLASMRRGRAYASANAEVPELDAALRDLADEAPAFAPALGAARTTRHEPLSLTKRRLRALAPERSARAFLVAWGALLLSAAIALLGPAVVAVRVERASERTLATVATERREIADTQRRLANVSGELNELQDLLGDRRSMLTLLDQVTRALPSTAAIVTLRADSAGGHIVTLATNAASAVAALDSVPGITGAELLGPVSRETIAERTLERATVHFRWATPRETQ